MNLVDVTRLHEVQAARREIAERYRLLVDNVREYAIVMLDTEGRVADWNRGAERLLGFSGEEVVGRPISLIFTEGAREAGVPERELATAAREGQASDDRWHVRRDGSRFWVTGVMTALYEEDGSLRGFAKILRDDTARKEVETARLHFQSLFESAPGLYCVVEPEGYEISAASDAYLEATMTRRDEITGRELFEVFPDDPEDLAATGEAELRASLERVKAQRRADVMPVQRYPIRRPVAEGGGFEERFWSVVNSPVFGSAGELVYIIHRVEDVTPFVVQMRDESREAEGHRLLERRAEQMEAEIVLRARELHQANEELRRLNETLEGRVQEQTRDIRELATRLTLAEQAERHRIARVLHDDLQQMLFGTQLKLELVREQLGQEEDDPLVERVTDAHRLLKEAIEKTRRLSVDLSPNILDGEGLAEAIGWLATQMQEMHGVEVEIDARQRVRVPDEGLRALLFQAVRELLFNVTKHAGVSRARVELEGEGDSLSAAVADEGAGFDVDRVGRHGQGLAHLRERVRLVGGEVEIRSAPGEGTRVTLRVPLGVLEQGGSSHDGGPPREGSHAGPGGG